jgi:hypothetical protein
VSNDPRCPESALDLLRITLGYALNSRQYLVQPQFWAEATLRDGSIVTFGASDGGVPRLSAPVWSVTEALNPAGEVTSVHLDYRASPGNGESHGAPAASVIGGDSTGFGHRFVDFALGRSTSFPVDTPVALYFGNVYRRTLSNKDAQNIRTWRTCAAYAGHRCPPSAVATIAAYEQATGKPVRLGRGGAGVGVPCALQDDADRHRRHAGDRGHPERPDHVPRRLPRGAVDQRRRTGRRGQRTPRRPQDRPLTCDDTTRQRSDAAVTSFDVMSSLT